MEHKISVFVGPWRALAGLTAGITDPPIVMLDASPDRFILAADDDLLDALHRINGTGEWLDHGARLSSTDLAAAARASKGCALAYLETNYVGHAGSQSAAVWHDGDASLKPATMAADELHRRAPQFWPVNAALRSIGVVAAPGEDEFTTFGLAAYHTNDAILAAGRKVIRDR